MSKVVVKHLNVLLQLSRMCTQWAIIQTKKVQFGGKSHHFFKNLQNGVHIFFHFSEPIVMYMLSTDIRTIVSVKFVKVVNISLIEQ